MVNRQELGKLEGPKKGGQELKLGVGSSSVGFRVILELLEGAWWLSGCSVEAEGT